MRLVWDEPKGLANLKKHGLDFADAIGFDWRLAVIEPGKPDQFGRQRYKSLASIPAQLFQSFSH